MPSRVEELKFNRTNQRSSDLTPFIEARRRSSGVFFAHPALWEVTWEGEDITREILDQVKNLYKTGEAGKSDSRPDRVFVVYGHDHQAVDQTEILIRRFGLTPIILRDAPSGGQTLIEKFETYSNVGCAIVLLTPDDIGGLDVDHLSPRARQNVVWEWGYLVAKLGRKQVVCLYKGSVEMPSDLHGLVTIHISGDIREKAEEVRRELIAAGCKIS